MPESVCGLSEPFSHYFCRGRDAKYLLQEDQTLASMDPSWLLDALSLFESDCTCCFRKHDGVNCVKPFGRLLLGLCGVVLKREGDWSGWFRKLDGMKCDKPFIRLLLQA